MFKHIILQFSSDDDEDDDENDDDQTDVEDTDEKYVDIDDVDEEVDNDVIETIELTVFLKCRDQWLSKDQVYYTDELGKEAWQ